MICVAAFLGLGVFGAIKVIATEGEVFEKIFGDQGAYWTLIALVGFMGGLFWALYASQEEGHRMHVFESTFGFDPRPHKIFEFECARNSLNLVFARKRIKKHALLHLVKPEAI